MTVKIYDVAKQSGVSVGTVSRVFNGYTDISEATKQKVYAVANKLGYIPNVAARTLSSKSLQTIALILNDLTVSRFDGVSMPTIIGVYNYAAAHGMQFVFYPTTTKQQHEKSFDQFCLERNIDGAIVQGMHVDDPYIAQMGASKIPVVTIDLALAGQNSASISIDNVKAEDEATTAMVKLGKKRLAMISGTASAAVSVLREQGFRHACDRAGIPLVDYQVQHADYDMNLAKQKVLELFQLDPDIDGLVCASDAMAIGALNALKILHKRIPEDVALVGFDNLLLSEYTDPTISSVEQHMDKMSARAAEVLASMMKGEKLTTHQFYSPYEFIQRQSTGKKPAAL